MMQQIVPGSTFLITHIMTKVTPFETYKAFIALKTHFCKDGYDYIQHRSQRIKAKPESFYKRKDRHYFERLSRQYKDDEIVNLFVSNFATDEDPETVYMANIVKYGERTYKSWQKKIQSLSYTFKQDSHKLFDDQKIDDVFDCSQGHPPLLRSYLAGDISLESVVIYDRILGYVKDFDKKLDPYVWGGVSKKIKKYSPFINIDVFRYKKILKEIVL